MPMSLFGVPFGTAYANGSASFCSRSGSAALSLNVTVFAVSSARIPFDRSQRLRLLPAGVGADDARVEAAAGSGGLEVALDRVADVARLDGLAGRELDPLAHRERVRLAAVRRLGDRLGEVGARARCPSVPGTCFQPSSASPAMRSTCQFASYAIAVSIDWPGALQSIVNVPPLWSPSSDVAGVPPWSSPDPPLSDPPQPAARAAAASRHDPAITRRCFMRTSPGPGDCVGSTPAVMLRPAWRSRRSARDSPRRRVR